MDSICSLCWKRISDMFEDVTIVSMLLPSKYRDGFDKVAKPFCDFFKALEKADIDGDNSNSKDKSAS